MKSFFDFKIKTIETPVEIQEEIMFEAVDYVDTEGVIVESKESDPPAVLVMRRKSIRQLNAKQKVALYYVEKINKYITIPYGEESSIPQVKENNISKFRDIVKSNLDNNIMLEDGTWKKINVSMAQSILKVYETLDKENKNIFVEMVNKNSIEFDKVIDFSLEQAK